MTRIRTSVRRWPALAAALLTIPLAAAPAVAAEPGMYAGPGFDTCTAPPAATMNAWLASPYRAVGIYFGGNNRACAQPALTAGWVAAQLAAGWHLIPIYLGPQASCTQSSKPNRIDNTKAAAQGRATAEDAVAQAAALGLPRESVLIYDMEGYQTTDAVCRAGVLAFMSAWSARLHDLGYLSGFYSSISSGVADQVANYHAAGYVRPDYLDFARWDQVVTVTDPAIPDSYWSPHRRIKQYRGDHVETWGGVSLNIDNDHLDVAPLPPARFADFTGNGWADVLARTGGDLHVYPGNGTYADVAARIRLGGGWQAMNAIVRIGDLDGDGHEDVIARQASNGVLWFYPGAATGVGTRHQIGTNWNTMREITATGDFTGDGRPDLLAIQTSTNVLYVYSGLSGGRLGARVQISAGWNALSELAGVGDFTRDGLPDLVARASDGKLYLYPGRSGGLAARIQIGTNWNTMRDLVGVGDFDRDGYPDLAAVRIADGRLYLYAGTGSALRSARALADGFGGRQPVL
jgi:Rv2525c-like, glycoside hydrolase-like domain/FG-GAP-like repeat